MLFFGVKGTRTHEKAILKLPPESKDPKGRFQDTTGTNYYTILGVVFHSFSYFGVSWGIPGTGLEKDAEKVRNQTLQNIENGVPVSTGAQFSFSPRHLQIVDFESIFGFILVLFCSLEGTRAHEKAILKPPSESKHPKGRFQDTTGTKKDNVTILGVVFHSFSYLGRLGESLAQV